MQHLLHHLACRILYGTGEGRQTATREMRSSRDTQTLEDMLDLTLVLLPPIQVMLPVTLSR